MTAAEAYAPSYAPARKVRLARASFAYFVKQFWAQVPGAGHLKWNWHLDLFCEEAQRIAEKVFAGEPCENDVIINVSPGTSKSTVWSILFPCWIWTRMPEARILSASHTDQLVLDLANKSRHVIKGEKYGAWFPEILLREDQDTKGYYANTAGGDRLTCTVGGKSPMGFHAHFQIVDDPIDPKKVLSDVELASARQFMADVLPTRKVDKLVSVMALIMQRLGLGDPTDVVLESQKQEGSRPVRHICLPSELERDGEGNCLDTWVKPKELASRYVNGLMDPARLGERELRQYKTRPHYYSTQFLQRPYAPGGGMFQLEWFNQRVRAAPYASKRIRYWDRSATEDAGCYTAGVLLAKGPDGNAYVEDVVHGQWEPDKRNAIMRATALKDRTRYGPKYEPKIWVEDEGGSSGKDANKGVARALAGFSVRFDDVTGSKDVRAEPWAGFLSTGCVYIVDNGESQGHGKAGWDVAGYVEEHVRFRPDMKQKRLGKYKDQVDSSSGGFNILFPLPGPTALRSITMTSAKRNACRIVACTYDELATMVFEQRALLVAINDPEVGEGGDDGPRDDDRSGSSGACSSSVGSYGVAGAEENGLGQKKLEQRLAEARERREVMSSDAGDMPSRKRRDEKSVRVMSKAVQYVAAGGTQPPALPQHGIDHLLDSLILTFADVDPAEHQDDWGCPVPPWNVPASELTIKPEDSKRLWSFLLRRRDPPHELIVISEPDGRRAWSVAEGVRSALNLPADSLWTPKMESDSSGRCDNSGQESNGYIVEVVKRGRGMVMS